MKLNDIISFPKEISEKIKTDINSVSLPENDETIELIRELANFLPDNLDNAIKEVLRRIFKSNRKRKYKQREEALRTYLATRALAEILGTINPNDTVDITVNEDKTGIQRKVYVLKQKINSYKQSKGFKVNDPSSLVENIDKIAKALGGIAKLSESLNVEEVNDINNWLQTIKDNSNSIFEAEKNVKNAGKLLEQANRDTSNLYNELTTYKGYLEGLLNNGTLKNIKQINTSGIKEFVQSLSSTPLSGNIPDGQNLPEEIKNLISQVNGSINTLNDIKEKYHPLKPLIEFAENNSNLPSITVEKNGNKLIIKINDHEVADKTLKEVIKKIHKISKFDNIQLDLNANLNDINNAKNQINDVLEKINERIGEIKELGIQRYKTAKTYLGKLKKTKKNLEDALKIIEKIEKLKESLTGNDEKIEYSFSGNADIDQINNYISNLEGIKKQINSRIKILKSADLKNLSELKSHLNELKQAKMSIEEKIKYLKKIQEENGDIVNVINALGKKEEINLDQIIETLKSKEDSKAIRSSAEQIVDKLIYKIIDKKMVKKYGLQEITALQKELNKHIKSVRKKLIDYLVLEAEIKKFNEELKNASKIEDINTRDLESKYKELIAEAEKEYSNVFGGRKNKLKSTYITMIKYFIDEREENNQKLNSIIEEINGKIQKINEKIEEKKNELNQKKRNVEKEIENDLRNLTIDFKELTEYLSNELQSINSQYEVNLDNNELIREIIKGEIYKIIEKDKKKASNIVEIANVLYSKIEALKNEAEKYIKSFDNAYNSYKEMMEPSAKLAVALALLHYAKRHAEHKQQLNQSS